MNLEQLNYLKQDDFLSKIITIICDYAYYNKLPIDDTVNTIGENLISITEIATFKNWKGSEY